jgi:hypothetical protein
VVIGVEPMTGIEPAYSAWEVEGRLVAGPEKMNTAAPIPASTFTIHSVQHFEPTADRAGTVTLLGCASESDRTVREHIAATAEPAEDEPGGNPARAFVYDSLLTRGGEASVRTCLRLAGGPANGRRGPPAAQVDRSAVRGPAPLVGAIGRMCEVHHGSDLSERNAIRVQVGVDLLGNLVVRPAPPEIVADEVRHPDDGLFVARRPSEAEGAQLIEVPVIDGIGSRNRSASNQGSASHNGDGQSGQPAR